MYRWCTRWSELHTLAAVRRRSGIWFSAASSPLLSTWGGVVPFIGSGFGFSPDGTTSRISNLVGAGLLMLRCGAWFASVSVARLALEAGCFHAASPSLTLVYWMSLAIGPGVLLAALGAFAVGWARRHGGRR